MDIEGAFRRNVDGAWAKLRYWSVVNRDVAKCGGAPGRADADVGRAQFKNNIASLKLLVCLRLGS
jgi:hypothetical protein